MHHIELGKKKDVKGIKIRANHMIQSRHLSPSLSFQLQGNLQMQLCIMQCVKPSGLGLLLCLGEHSWQIFAKHEQAWKHKELLTPPEWQDFCSMEMETNSNVETWEDTNYFLKFFLVLKPTN